MFYEAVSPGFQGFGIGVVGSQIIDFARVIFQVEELFVAVISMVNVFKTAIGQGVPVVLFAITDIVL